jgi:hypothetical protein
MGKNKFSSHNKIAILLFVNEDWETIKTVLSTRPQPPIESDSGVADADLEDRRRRSGRVRGRLARWLDGGRFDQVDDLGARVKELPSIKNCNRGIRAHLFKRIIVNFTYISSK